MMSFSLKNICCELLQMMKQIPILIYLFIVYLFYQLKKLQQ